SRYCLAAVATLTEDAQAASNALGQAILQAEQLKLPTQGIEVKSDQGTAFKANAREDYNTRRPHQALDYKTPLEVIRSAQETGIV
ncbi:integrase core domain-containing protein, partial [Meiothermus cerbereus]